MAQRFDSIIMRSTVPQPRLATAAERGAVEFLGVLPDFRFSPERQPPPPSATPPTPSPAPIVPDDLRPLLLALPIAHDGHVIMPEYYNALRAAVLAMAQRLGAGVLAGTALFTFAPRFAKNDTNLEWTITEAGATVPTGSSGKVHGWLDIQLPDGTMIDGMKIRGKRVNAIDDCKVSLLRYPLEGASLAPTTLIEIDLKDPADPLEKSAQIESAKIAAASGIDATAAEVAAAKFRLIDNSNFRYVVSAQASPVAAAANIAQISSIQISCREF